MNLDDVFDILHLTFILAFFANGITTLLDPIDWYGYIFAMFFFLLTAIGIKQYQIRLQNFKEEATK